MSNNVANVRGCCSAKNTGHVIDQMAPLQCWYNRKCPSRASRGVRREQPRKLWKYRVNYWSLISTETINVTAKLSRLSITRWESVTVNKVTSYKLDKKMLKTWKTTAFQVRAEFTQRGIGFKSNLLHVNGFKAGQLS